MVLAAVALLLVLACRGYDWDALGRYKGDNISSLHYVRGRVVEVIRQIKLLLRQEAVLTSQQAQQVMVTDLQKMQI